MSSRFLEHIRVGVSLSIKIEEASKLPPYVLGTEPPLRRSPRRVERYRKAAELDEILTPFVPDLIAGVPSGVVAKRVGLQKGQVAHWKRAQGIDRHSPRASLFAMTRFMARSLLGDAPPAVAHPVGGVGDGKWAIPEYLLRQPLHYDLFVELVGILAEAGVAAPCISLGLGVCQRDVELAIAVYARSAK